VAASCRTQAGRQTGALQGEPRRGGLGVVRGEPQAAGKRAGLSRQAVIDIRRLADEIAALGRLAVQTIEEPGTDRSAAVLAAKDRINTLADVMLDDHDERLATGKCRLLPGIAFVELVMNLRRVANHMRNIGISMSLRMPERSQAARRFAG
jgi:Na+/phosphate symporter